MRRTCLVAAAAVLALRGTVAAAADPCAVSWTDAGGDTTYGLVYPVPLADPDLDVTRATLRADARTVTLTVTVAHLDPAGPAYGTGHGIGLYLTKYGTSLSFAARTDATYGDRASAPDGRTPVRLAVDARRSAYVLTVSRADLARLAGTRSRGGVLGGIGAFALRSDHVQGASEAAGLASGIGTSADSATAADGARLDLDACDRR
jgi:opacity protein-like surface antigen